MKTEPKQTSQAKAVVTETAPAKQDKEKTLEEKIVDWKAQYGKLYKSTINGESYIWRKLKRKEYTELMNYNEELDELQEVQAIDRLYLRQEKIAQLVVLYPENISQLIIDNAGLATTISDEVVIKSGFQLSGTEEL